MGASKFVAQRRRASFVLVSAWHGRLVAGVGRAGERINIQKALAIVQSPGFCPGFSLFHASDQHYRPISTPMPGVLISTPGSRSRLPSPRPRRSPRPSVLIWSRSRSRDSTHRSLQTGPTHSCRHTRSALACWGMNAIVVTTVAATAKVVNNVLMKRFPLVAYCDLNGAGTMRDHGMEAQPRITSSPGNNSRLRTMVPQEIDFGT